MTRSLFASYSITSITFGCHLWCFVSLRSPPFSDDIKLNVFQDLSRVLRRCFQFTDSPQKLSFTHLVNYATHTQHASTHSLNHNASVQPASNMITSSYTRRSMAGARIIIYELFLLFLMSSLTHLVNYATPTQHASTHTLNYNASVQPASSMITSSYTRRSMAGARITILSLRSFVLN